MRVRRWVDSGVIDNVFKALHEELNTTIDEKVLSLDSTCVKVHLDGSGCQKNGQQSIGKTCDGTNTKIHAIVANEKALLAFHLSRGNLYDSPQRRLLINQMNSEYKNSYALMDKAYEGVQTRQTVLDKGMIPVVPPQTNRKNQGNTIKLFIDAEMKSNASSVN